MENSFLFPIFDAIFLFLAFSPAHSSVAAVVNYRKVRILSSNEIKIYPKARESAMDQLASSNISSEKEENGHKIDDNEEEASEEDEFDLAYKMIFTDTLRMRDDQVG